MSHVPVIFGIADMLSVTTLIKEWYCTQFMEVHCFFTEMCNTDNYTEGTVAIIDYIIDEEQVGCNLVNMVLHHIL